MYDDIYGLERRLKQLRYDLVENVLPDETAKRKAKIILDIATLKSSPYPVLFFWGCALSELLRRCKNEDDVVTVERVIEIVRSLEDDQICVSNLAKIKTYKSFSLEGDAETDMGKVYREGKRYEHLKIPTEISDGLYRLHESEGSGTIIGYAALYWRIMLNTFRSEFERQSHGATY